MRVQTFIYAPRSGDRVVAENPTASLVVVKWTNGCRHLVGQHVVLSYYAATPGAHWRYDASFAASQIVAATGGVAWDERGTIYLAVPPERALAADKMMSFIGRIPAGEAQENQKALYLAGLLRIIGVGRGLEFEPLPEHQVEASTDVEVVAGPVTEDRAKYNPEPEEELMVMKTIVSFRVLGHPVEVSAPATWGCDIFGGRPAAEEKSA